MAQIIGEGMRLPKGISVLPVDPKKPYHHRSAYSIQKSYQRAIARIETSLVNQLSKSSGSAVEVQSEANEDTAKQGFVSRFLTKRSM